MAQSANRRPTVAIITMFFLFAMISFVTNLAAPIGTIWGNTFEGNSVLGMMGNMMNFLAYLFMGIPAGKLLERIGYKKTALWAMAVGVVGLVFQYLSSIVGTDTEVLSMTAHVKENGVEVAKQLPVCLNFFIYLLGAFICGFCVCMLNTVVNPMLNLLGGGGNKGNQLIQTGGALNSLAGTLTPFFVGALIGQLSKDTSMNNVTPLLFIAMGNWMPKIKQNSTLGIKIKWTLYNEENWNKTHRVAGFVWVIGGVIFCLMGFVAEKMLLFLLPLEVILLAVVPMVYSWNLAWKQKQAGTFTESQVNKDLKKHPVLMGVTAVLVTAILQGVGCIMFTGDIDYTVTNEKLTIDADFHSDLAISLETIDSMELCQGHPGGTRTWGFASARLMMGWFESDELGDYTRYTYTGCDSYILLTSGEDILILNAKTESDTQALYETLTEKLAG